MEEKLLTEGCLSYHVGAFISTSWSRSDLLHLITVEQEINCHHDIHQFDINPENQEPDEDQYDSSSHHCEMCGNPLQPSVMPAPVSGPVIFHPTANAAAEGERTCEKHTWQGPITPPPPPTDLSSPHYLLLFLRPPSHLLSFPPVQALRGEMDPCLVLVMSLLAA